LIQFFFTFFTLDFFVYSLFLQRQICWWPSETIFAVSLRSDVVAVVDVVVVVDVDVVVVVVVAAKKKSYLRSSLTSIFTQTKP
jgi:hypothetical protein